MEETEPDDLVSTGSRSDRSEDEECGDFDLQNSAGSKASGAAGAHGVSRSPFRPPSPALGKHIFTLYHQITDCLAEDDFDVSPDEDERRAQAVLHGAPKDKGKGAPFHKFIHTLGTYN